MLAVDLEEDALVKQLLEDVHLMLIVTQDALDVQLVVRQDLKN
jgi:hypothetical protein